MKIAVALQPQVGLPSAATFSNPELLANGDFSGGGAGWIYDSPEWTFSGGTASVTSMDTEYLGQNLEFVNGQAYTVIFTIVSISSGASMRATFSGFSGSNNGTLRTSAGTYTQNITASGDPISFAIEFLPGDFSTTAVIDNVSLKRA